MSARTRLYALVAAVAALAAAVTVAGALVLGEETSAGGGATAREPAPRENAPPLELDVLLRDDSRARALRAAERAYERGDRAAARRRFAAVLRRDPASVEAAVGEAIASWPNGTLERLRDLVARHPESGVARLHLGLALLSAGEREEAEAQWREVERRDPDSPAALTAEDLLHPAMPPGRPYFLPARPAPPALAELPPARQLAALARRAESGDAREWILYGAALQRAGRPVSARVAFDRAVARESGNVEARTAAAVARFDKDDPAAAFSRLGPLASAHPRSPVVRFHLGLSLLWLRQVEQARSQLRLAERAGPQTVHGRAAARLRARLSAIRP